MLTGLLLAAAISFDCTSKIIDIESGGKIYNYAYQSNEKKELRIGEKVYTCVEDYPSRVGVGIKTLSRRRCGLLTLFFQTYHKACEYDDFNPPPDRFNNYAEGQRLLKVQHECIKKGMKLVGGWYKMRDKNGVEWELEHDLDGHDAACSEKEKVVVFREKYVVKKTGDVLIYMNIWTYPIRSIKNKPVPAF